MTKSSNLTDQERRIYIGKLIEQEPINNTVLANLQKLNNDLYNPNNNPLEDRLNKLFIPTNEDINDLHIAQIKTSIYEKLTDIIYNALSNSDTNTPKELLDSKLQPFILNSFFSNKWDNTNLPSQIIENIEPFYNGSVIKKALQFRLQNLNPEVVKLTTKICAIPTIRYNIYKFVDQNYEKVKYLADTNPAIITLYIYTQDIENPIEHEGEIIKTIRKEIYNKNPNYELSSYWKKLTKRSHESIYNHMTVCAQQNIFYNKSNLVTELLIASTIVDVELRPTKEIWLNATNDFTLRTEIDRRKILQILLKEFKKHPDTDDPWYQNLKHQITDVSDYLRNQNPDHVITSKSWNRLLQKSDKWHRDMIAHRNINSHDPNTMTCWNSLIDKPIKFEEDNVIITPLTNSVQLYMESDEVQHCVRSYVNSCSKGYSRLFKIRPIDEYERDKVGTLEIKIDNANDPWRVAQVRGLRNHPMNNNMTLIADKIANIYTTKWNKTKHPKDNRHTHWTQDRTDNKTSSTN